MQISKIELGVISTYTESWNVDVILVLLRTENHSFKPLGEHPDAHFSPSGTGLEQNGPRESETHSHSMPGINRDTQNLREINSAEWDTDGKECGKQT
jgi:hypothetical protein